MIRDMETMATLLAELASLRTILGELEVMEEEVVQLRAEQATLRASESDLRAMFMAMSAPLIPISDEIVVMPLIGILDTRRIERVMQPLIEKIQGSRAQVAVIDISGVAVVDSRVADALLRGARSVQLLGASVILTGIRSDMPQALVTNGAERNGIVTRGTLQSGIAYAMSSVRWAQPQPLTRRMEA